MTVANIYPVAFLSDALAPRGTCQFNLRRFDEQSGSGDGRFWTSRLAAPLWEVALTLSPRRREAAAEISAKIRALDGGKRTLLFADGLYAPASGQSPGTNVTVSAISADRQAIALSGLPSGYRVSAGDRMSIVWATNRYFFAEFAEPMTANGSGVTGQISIMPYLPQSIATGASVQMARPILRAIVPPGGFTPFTDISGFLSDGASLILLQKP